MRRLIETLGCSRRTIQSSWSPISPCFTNGRGLSRPSAGAVAARAATIPGKRGSIYFFSRSSSPRRSRQFGCRPRSRESRQGLPGVLRARLSQRMAENLVVYTVIHQPRRLKLPAQVIPAKTSPEAMPEFVFDEAMDRRYFEKVAKYAYIPASSMFRELAEKGWRMSIGFSNSFLTQAERWGPKVLDSFKQLCASPNVEVVCVEPYHSWLLYLDIVAFKEAMIQARRRLEEVFQKAVVVTDTTEMFMSNDVYFALQQCGFSGAFMEGRSWQMGWREPTHVYRYPLQRLALLCRHHELSDDVGYRFSNQSWAEFPLTADRYAGWVGGAVGGRGALC